MSIKKQYQFFTINNAVLLSFFLVLGCYFRVINLESKIFWVDEIATAVRISGYTISEVTNDLIQRNILNFNDLLVYQNLAPDKSFIDSWYALTKSPEHAPLYFVLTRLWMQIWGNSIVVMRSLSIVISLLTFPALYWLCQELFNKSFIAQIAVILMSISPFFVTYAQEARPYSLWTVSILVMGASLLRSIRLNNKQSWLLYSISLIIGLYTSLFSIYVALFQGIYVLLIGIENHSKVIKQYCKYSLISLIAFSPWIWIIVSHLDLLHENTSWMRGNFNLAEIIAVFIGTVLLIFGDLPISQESDPVQTAIAVVIIAIVYLCILIASKYIQKKQTKFILVAVISSSLLILFNYIYLDYVSIIGALVALMILSLSIYSLYYLIIKTHRNCWLFILCLILSLPLPLLIMDIVNQGQSSTAPRYLIPLQLGIQIAVAYTIGSQIEQHQRSKYQTSNSWQLILVIFLILGIFSCVRNFNLSPFYQKGRNINNPAIAEIINPSNSALVMVESDNAMDLLSLAYSLSDQVKYKVIKSNLDTTKYFNQFQDVFILKASSNLQNNLSKNFNFSLERVYKSHLFSADEIPLDLWKIK